MRSIIKGMMTAEGEMSEIIYMSRDFKGGKQCGTYEKKTLLNRHNGTLPTAQTKATS